MKRLWWRMAASVLALVAIVLAGATTGAAAPVPSSTVTIGATLAPDSLDLTTDAAAAIPEALLYNVYEGLVKLDRQGGIVPLLATSWSNRFTPGHLQVHN